MIDMKGIVGCLILAFLLTGGAAPVLAQEDSCVACHGELDDEGLRAPTEGMAVDVHGYTLFKEGPVYVTWLIMYADAPAP